MAKVMSMRSLFVIAALFGLIVQSLAAATPMSDYSRAEISFNSKTEIDRRSIQEDLIWTGDYSQILDGLFGNNTFKAIQTYESRIGANQDGVLQPWERSKLRQDAQTEREQVGYRLTFDQLSGLTFGLPEKLLASPQDANGTRTWRSKDGNFSIIVGVDAYVEGSFAGLYASFGNLEFMGNITYRTFRPGFFIITGERSGVKTYVRAIDTGAASSGVMIVWNGNNDDYIRKLVVAISNSTELRKEMSEAEASPKPNGASSDPKDEKIVQVDLPPAQKLYQTGTGFFVSSSGHLLTNAHVVNGCKEASLRLSDGRLSRAAIIGSSDRSDLAILKSEVTAPATASFRSEPTLRLGTDIIVFGYPRLDLLTSTGNLVNGLVSGLAGPNDDASLIQISAPVQSGNSGGAVLDRSGNVVAVVVAKTNITAEKDRIEVLQQANFAINGDIAKSFLGEHGVKYASANSTRDMITADIADAAKSFTAIVICQPS
jgi:S1-C subfamily serine protease